MHRILLPNLPKSLCIEGMLVDSVAFASFICSYFSFFFSLYRAVIIYTLFCFTSSFFFSECLCLPMGGQLRYTFPSFSCNINMPLLGFLAVGMNRESRGMYELVTILPGSVSVSAIVQILVVIFHPGAAAAIIPIVM